MSQQKVDRYKEQKANRKRIMRKEKMMDIVRKILLSVVALALVGWLGFSGYSHYKAGVPRPTAEVDYSAITNYMSGLQ
ncbi:MAG: hypothetical protein PHW34_00975 [Hespellia sp.]|nr:hypothetical protein [Hespellia sp.]